MKYFVEGNIGCGKTTLLSLLSNRLQYELIPEPVEIWSDFFGENVLSKYYHEPKKFGFQMEMLAFTSSLYSSKKFFESNAKICISERSPHSVKLFSKLSFDSGSFSQTEFNICQYATQFAVTAFDSEKPTLIYINTPPEVCFERSILRARPGENVSIDYLQKLDDLHRSYFLENFALHNPVILIDGLRAPEQCVDDLVKLIE
jgi:deoxyadenosine/deoxycytidine kinase